jgi:hypothetical protein
VAGVVVVAAAAVARRDVEIAVEAEPIQPPLWFS